MKPRTLSIFGSTGTIGANTLALVDAFPGRFEVRALSAGRNLEKLREQIRRYRPRHVAVQRPDDVAALAREFRDVEFYGGEKGLCEVARAEKVDAVVMGIVGFAALAPTLEAVAHCRTLALANKETLVAAGGLLKREIARHDTLCIPVDSEHNAIYQLLHGRRREEIQTIVLTASGGPLFRKPELDLETVTPEQAIAHPNWKMGPKISVDSATLMNKGLELIEAAVFFDFPASGLEVWIHPQSIVHGALWFTDNSCLAQLSKPDMRSSIGFAIGYPERLPASIPKLSLKDMANLEFHPPDEKRFPALRLARQALAAGASQPIALNAANEIAVEAFLAGRIRFPRIPQIVETVLNAHRAQAVDTIDAVFAIDAAAREQARAFLK